MFISFSICLLTVSSPVTNGNTHTYTVTACFHLGLCVLLHFSVLFDWPSTATSTYGLGPNQFFLFSFSLAESTAKHKWGDPEGSVTLSGFNQKSSVVTTGWRWDRCLYHYHTVYIAHLPMLSTTSHWQIFVMKHWTLQCNNQMVSGRAGYRYSIPLRYRPK